MKKNNNIFATIVLTVIRLIIMSILVYCLYQIIPKLLEYKESDDVYERIRKEAIKENPDSEDTEAETSTDKEESEKQETETEDESLKKSPAYRLGKVQRNRYCRMVTAGQHQLPDFAGGR